MEYREFSCGKGGDKADAARVQERAISECDVLGLCEVGFAETVTEQREEKLVIVSFYEAGKERDEVDTWIEEARNFRM